MRKTNNKPQEEEIKGAPDWMVTFSDCMTLLLTFFVLLLSFSSFDNNDFKKLKVIFARKLDSISLQKTDKSSFDAFQLIHYNDDLDKGSEKPTLEKGTVNNVKIDTEPLNFHKRKVFTKSSANIFWGQGTVISSQGKTILSSMASYLMDVPCRVVISENGPIDENDSVNFGLQRAWTVVDYLTTIEGLDKGQLSISAASLTSTQHPASDKKDFLKTKSTRTLEIVLLERSIYN